MKKKSSIIKLSIIGVVLILGIVLSFVSVNFFGNNSFKSFASSINFGQDLKGGVYAVFTADESDEKGDLDVRMSGTRAKLQDMLANKGYTEASVVILGNDSIRVEVPSEYNNPDTVFQLIGTPAAMKFTDGSSEVIEIYNKHIVNVSFSGYDASYGYIITMTLNRAGSKLYNNASGTVAVSAFVNGSDLSLSVINSGSSGGRLTLTLGSKDQNAYNLPDQIVAGQFDALLTLSETGSATPVFGKNTLLLGALAVLAGLILIFAFMIWRYRLFGAVTAAALLVFSFAMLIMFSLVPGMVITVSSCIGLILAIILNADASIAFCERVKYEYKNGKSILASFYAGFKKAFRSSIDTHAIAAIASGALFLLGTTAVKSFAAALFIGTVLSFLTLFFVVKGLSRYVLAIDYVSENLYGLERGAEYASLGADETDASILAEMEKESAEKANEGGQANEAI